MEKITSVRWGTQGRSYEGEGLRDDDVKEEYIQIYSQSDMVIRWVGDK